ncbi:hypothetical protein ACIBCT_35175 [Streptosporangium sp. NPDC050855]|uniref:hypothetical protein n=1 Tax=Streptosporangium sp. NPDC050855 TaxID=3366194 RepID=UPI0037BBB5C3
MQVKWWGKFLERVEKSGRPEEAARQLRIPMTEIRQLFDAKPELMSESHEAQARYHKNRANEILRKMLKGNTFKRACSSSGINEEAAKRLFKYSPELEQKYEEQLAEWNKSNNWLANEEQYSEADAITITWGVTYAGRIVSVSVHKFGCKYIPKGTTNLHQLNSISVTSKRAAEIVREAEKFDGATRGFLCKPCGGIKNLPSDG